MVKINNVSWFNVKVKQKNKPITFVELQYIDLKYIDYIILVVVYF